MSHQLNPFKRATDAVENDDEADEFDARYRLTRVSPEETRLLLPTAFGNVSRAYERQSFLRWHLSKLAAWPGIELLLSPHEAQVHADLRPDVAFFVNDSLLSTVAR